MYKPFQNNENYTTLKILFLARKLNLLNHIYWKLFSVHASFRVQKLRIVILGARTEYMYEAIAFCAVQLFHHHNIHHINVCVQIAYTIYYNKKDKVKTSGNNIAWKCSHIISFDKLFFGGNSYEKIITIFANIILFSYYIDSTQSSPVM